MRPLPTPPEAPVARRGWARQVVSLLLAGGLVAWVILQLDYPAFRRALETADPVAYLGFMLVFVVVLLAVDSVAIRAVYARYVCPVTLREVAVLRGASYLFAVVNYHIGQAWLTWFASKVYGARLGRVAGATLLNYATMFGSLALLACGSFALMGRAVPWLGTILLALGVAALGYGAFLVARPQVSARLPGVPVLFEAGIVGHLQALAWRLPHMFVLFVGMWLPLGFFGVDVPLGDALAYIPILMLVGALPITPQGVGTRDVIAVQLLGAYAPAGAETESVAAATLCWAVSLTLVQVLIAPLFMASARRLLARASAAKLAAAAGRSVGGASPATALAEPLASSGDASP